MLGPQLAHKAAYHALLICSNEGHRNGYLQSQALLKTDSPNERKRIKERHVYPYAYFCSLLKMNAIVNVNCGGIVFVAPIMLGHVRFGPLRVLGSNTSQCL